MILSHTHQFVFIKSSKTAGTSIEAYLDQFLGPRDVVTPVFPPVDGHTPRNHAGLWNPLREIRLNRGRYARRTMKHWVCRRRFFNHIPARHARGRMPARVWDQYLTFCVERNPWDKVVSYWKMNCARHGEVTLDHYLNNMILPVNAHYYTDGDGRMIVDRVLRYERLDEELGLLLAELNIPWQGSLSVRAKESSRLKRTPYQEHFTPAQRDFVAKRFAREIELFGYTFD